MPIIYQYLFFPLLGGIGLFLHSLFMMKVIVSFLGKIGYPQSKETEWHIIWFIFQILVLLGMLFRAYYQIFLR